MAAWVAQGLDGLTSNVLSCAAADRDGEDVRPSRDWSTDQWRAAAEALADRGLVAIDAAGVIVPTDAGRAVHAAVEATTDELAAASYHALAPAELASLRDRLRSIATVVAASGALRYPNPIGLPPVA